jgi:uncharacterized protein (TIGR02001 family)
VAAASQPSPIIAALQYQRLFHAAAHCCLRRSIAARAIKPRVLGMYQMKKLLSAAAAATAILGLSGIGTAAQADSSLTGNIALTTDYMFRGISQTDGPAVQGGLDYSADQFYVGTWGSNVNFNNNLELDVYGGFKPTLGPVGLDLGVIGYLYPGADPSPTFDYAEFYAKGSIAPTSMSSLGAAVYYSPEFTGKTGQAWYSEVNGSFSATDALSFSGAVGYQWVDKIDFNTKTAAINKSYTTWNVGGTYTYSGLGFDLRYVGTDIDSNDPVWGDLAKDRVVFSVKKSL